ncbi:hypothetical protein F511_11568 [Dorcoceras hygrometricum]|uniref:Uncharacterized protein n=1 Tax=Dorcoceras hygrometricum TaxID=472368 RepID=A0A2Z7CUP2_9LAMI|nr:hypothetical protein F511_11568 [Dorcoceras hygrometricum]
MYHETYQTTVNPIPTFDIYESDNEVGVIYAPDSPSKPARKRTKRFTSQTETRTLKWGRCYRQGHSRRSCK